MKKDFKLQKVLDYRENILELEKKKLTQFQHKLTELNTKREAFLTDLEAKNIEIEALKQKSDFRFLKMYEDFIQKIKFMIMQIDNMIVKATQDVENQKKKVVTSLNDKKIMEKLKEKHVEDYRLYLNKEEMKMVDDMVVTRFKGVEDEK